MPLIDHSHHHDFRTAGISVLSSVVALRQEIAPVRVLLLDFDSLNSGGGTDSIHESPNGTSQSLTGLLALLSNTPLQVEISIELPGLGDGDFDGVIATASDPAQVPAALSSLLPRSSASLVMGEAARIDLQVRHGIAAEQLTRPLTEIVQHRITGDGSPLTAGQEPLVDVPVARTWRIGMNAISEIPTLQVLAHAPKAGVHVVYEPAIRRLFVLNHLALTPLGFARQQRRLTPQTVRDERHPQHDEDSLPPYTWRSHAHLLMGAWLNVAVYQPLSLMARAV